MGGMKHLSVAKRVGVYLLIVLVQVISALYTVLTRDAIKKGNADPLVFSLYRDACAFPILYIWAILAEHIPRGCCQQRHKAISSRGVSAGRLSDHLLRKDSLEADTDTLDEAETLRRQSACPRCRDIPRFIGLGLFGMFGNQFCYIMALEYISSDVAAILNLSQIVIVAILAASPIAVLLGAEQEKASWAIFLGIFLAISGALVMLQPWELASNATIPNSTAGNSTTPSTENPKYAWGGYVFVLGSCVAMSLYYLLQKKALREYGPVSVTAHSYLFGAIVMAAAAGIEIAINGNFQAFILSDSAWEALAFAVVANSVIKYGVSSIANKFVSATLLVAAGTLAPIFVIIFAYFDPKEQQTPQLSYLGGLGIVGGIAIVTYGRNRVERDSASSINLRLDVETESLEDSFDAEIDADSSKSLREVVR